MFLLLLILWPVAEIFVFIEVAREIGVLLALALIIVTWPIGTWAIRSQGSAAWRRLAAAAAQGRPPGREVLDGSLILLGGLLMMVPGFITDALGALLLLPPVRAGARGMLVRNFRGRFVQRAVRFGPGPGPEDIDSTATEVQSPRLPR